MGSKDNKPGPIWLRLTLWLAGFHFGGAKVVLEF